MLRSATTSRRRQSGEAGFILPTAMIVLLILTALTAAAVTVATQTSGSTARDANSKAAFEAAEAGLQVAAYRLNELEPEETKCINESAVISPTSELCKQATAESIGNEATFQYTTTPALAAGKKCAGSTIVAKSGVVQRCITSEGKVKGETPGVRLQTRIEAVSGALFPATGIVGLTEVVATGGGTLAANVASNGAITVEGGSKVEKTEICSPGKVTVASGSTVTEQKTRSGSECTIKAPLPATHATAASNEDSRITKGEDTVAGTVTYSGAPDYTLEVSSNGGSSLTLKGSKYYFCEVGVKGKLIIPTGHKVEIFIEKEGGCATKYTGEFVANNGGKIENETKNSADLLIVMAGKGPATFEGGSASEWLSLYAPEAQVKLANGAKLKGGIVGEKVRVEGGGFVAATETGTLTNGEGKEGRAAWVQCTPTGTTPEVGC
jgi:Tfp pilus assembly protein PilX